MIFVGVDLAWGERNGTGLCTMTADAVVDSTRRDTLDEIGEWLKPYTAGDCLVAIDAPLIVRNQTGRRPCESMVSRCFGRHEASTHSSNPTNASFRQGGRAKELAAMLGLETDPHFTPSDNVRRAIEVYPHTALVALFDLALTLKYKGKRGRTLAGRRTEFTRLRELLGSLSSADPPMDVRQSLGWSNLVEEIDTAATGAALDRAEDELDAYICAYVALYYWTHGEARCRVVGDTETGYIVTPVSEDQGACLDRVAADRSSGGAPPVARPRTPARKTS